MARKRTVLVTDDNEINRRILCKILSKDYDTIEAANGEEALNILKNDDTAISAVLLDIVMPVMDGYEFLEKQQKDKLISSVPVIVTTEKAGEEYELRALSLGACDFLSKPYKSAIIIHRLANTIKLRETAAFINTVERDSLTDVYNKEFFYQRAVEKLEANKATDYDIVCIDVERFKLINDLFGVAEGDKLLKFIGNTIKQALHGRGICGRLSGDVFVVMMPHQDKMKKELFEICDEEIHKYPISINLVLKYGVYVIDDRTLSIDVMCDRAKLAIDAIKGRYEVNVARYDGSIRERLIAEQLILNNMKTALKEGQFKVYFQPKYELATGHVYGAEALVRWEHPQNGFMMPGDFIPLFERNGFITDLDKYVWDSTCQKIRAWIDAGNTPIPASVNVSRADIYNPRLPQILCDIVSKYELEPRHLHLEITESAYTKDPNQLIDIVSQLKNKGFIIEMDDFGSGYSSLNMLSELPLDVVKLDMRFLQKGPTHKGGDTIIKFMIELVKCLGLSVITEGVETQQQVDMLREMGCDYAQGYYYSRPLPQDEFETLLRGSTIAMPEKESVHMLVAVEQDA